MSFVPVEQKNVFELKYAIMLKQKQKQKYSFDAVI